MECTTQEEKSIMGLIRVSEYELVDGNFNPVSIVSFLRSYWVTCWQI